MTILHQKYTTDKSKPYFICRAKAKEFPYHWHDEVEIIYILKGNINFVIETQTYYVKERDILIIKSGEIHRCYGGVDCEHIIIEFGHYLDNEILKTQTLIYPGASALLSKDLHVKENLHSKIEELILQIYDEYERKSQAWNFMIKSALYKIVGLLDRECAKEVKGDSNKNIIPGYYNEILHDVFEYIEENYKSNITLEEISRVANFSKHYFNKFFKKATNKTFARYVNDVRIEKAQTLLKCSKQSITEIAYEVGFNSIKTFNRVFKQKVGCTPSEYKQNQNMY